ncbi:hypothetical protein PV08_09008 [Exophiala spinifera]|uniref:CCHC-type domain-containing protein n=1 Tax=Exophiala spinifera TaxID=91928 RepID=A0A0D1Y9T5_9EURO|nr:uncharacterized protein PV08_09008 [Exophiala spinifera]KIW11736.1 hypothetical protein PV08_09008 [Exophiala spinifera]
MATENEKGTTRKSERRSRRSRQQHGLPTPDGTPAPETGRIMAEKEREEREERESTRVGTLSAIIETPHEVLLAAPSGAPVDNGTQNHQAADETALVPTEEQISLVQHVENCDPQDYQKMFGFKPTGNVRKDKENMVNLFRRQGSRLHPDFNKAKGADQAFESEFGQMSDTYITDLLLVACRTAEEHDVPDDEIDEVRTWDGEELPELRLSDDGKWTEKADATDGVEIPEPTEDRVLYAALNMKGPAFHWFEPIVMDHLTSPEALKDDETKEIFASFNVFVQKLKQIFGTPGEEQAASQRIHHLKQTGSAANYYALFKRLEAKLDWEDNAYAAAYYNGLIEIDNWLYERRLEKKGYRGRTGGPFNGNKGSSRSYGDPMDLDAMERGRSSRPKGKFQRKGPSNKERERRKKENLCYNCGKSGHRAKECGTKPLGLHMMQARTGAGEKKADTPAKIWMKRFGEGVAEMSAMVQTRKAEFQAALESSDEEPEQASNVSKAQKGMPEGTQTEGATPGPPPRTDGEEVAAIAGTFPSSREQDKEAEETTDKHSFMSWCFRYEDGCAIHHPNTGDSGWFPSRNKDKSPRKPRERQIANWDEEDIIDHMGENKYLLGIMRIGYGVAEVETKYWSKDSEGRTIFDPDCKDAPRQGPKVVVLERCFGCWDSKTHTHDSGGRRYDFPFEDKDELLVDEFDLDIAELYRITHKDHQAVMATTSYWIQVDGKPMFRPFSAKRVELRTVQMRICNDHECEDEGEGKHTHDIWGNTQLHVFLDEDEDDDMPSSGKNDEGCTSATPRETAAYRHANKYRVVSNHCNIAVLETQYWATRPCESWCLPGCKGDHKRFNPFGDPEKKTEMVPIIACDDWACHDWPHSHDVLGLDEFVPIRRKDEEAVSGGNRKRRRVVPWLQSRGYPYETLVLLRRTYPGNASRQQRIPSGPRRYPD